MISLFTGSAPGLIDIEPFNIFPGDATSATVDLPTPLSHGFSVFSTVICINNAGRQTVAYSDGVTILTDPPLSRDAFLLISTSNLTQYESRDGFLPSSDVTLIWGGFEEPSGEPLTYEVRLIEAGGAVSNWTNVGHTYSLMFSDLPFETNFSHMVQLRAVNLAGLESDSLTSNFTIVTSSPEVATSGKCIECFTEFSISIRDADTCSDSKFIQFV